MEPHADALSFFRPKTEEEMDRLQDFVDDLYERFLAHAAASRGMDADEVDAIARDGYGPGRTPWSWDGSTSSAVWWTL